MKKTEGICYLVGAGPGDPGLLTLRGRECLERADVVVYDYLSSPALLRYVPEGAEVIYAGKKAGAHTLTQTEIDRLLVKKTKQGRTVVRLKGGDPFLFGRGGEEAAALAEAGLRFEIVPGISSAIAGPAYAGIPVTHREHNAVLTIFTGHEAPTKSGTNLDYRSIASTPGTKVLLMGVERIREIADELLEHGMEASTPVVLTRWATTGAQQTLESSLGAVGEDVKRSGFRAPAVIVIGEVAGLRNKLNWFESRPLFGVRIAITRTRKQAGDLAAALRELGADAYELPTIRIEPPKDPAAFREVVSDVHTYDWLVFTSPNGVDAFFEEYYRVFEDARSLGPARIAAIGPATAERVRHFRFAVDLMPEKYVAEEIVSAFQKETSVENLKMLLPRAEQAREILPRELMRLGAIVDEAVAYRTVPETEDVAGGIARFREEGADVVTFTSSSTAENFHALGLPWPERCIAASIGPVTSATLRDLGIEPGLQASQHDIPGLIEALLQRFAKR